MDYPLGKRLRELPGPLLLTGHTGFKGTWMTFLLEHLNVPIVGYSLPAEKDSLYDRAQRTGVIPEIFADVRDYKTLENFMDLHQPSTIIHMAAQPLVLKSYESPRETFDVNVMGTVNVLDIAFKKDFVKAIIVVTTDKVYRNDNSGRAFVETDPLEGKDPYSASKVGTESVVAAWQQLARTIGGPRILVARSGNVIGGGDLAEKRIIPDLVRGALTNCKIEIRSPESTRPWLHVLDTLRGYIMCLEFGLSNFQSENFNFSPTQKSISVKDIVDIGTTYFPSISKLVCAKNVIVNMEAETLRLNSEKSRELLNWSPKWNQMESISRTFQWWVDTSANKADAHTRCVSEIEYYLD
jgi:CDP-glucose 4,6-dehydratase